jgi:RNA polymerase sigma-70 factor (ECF subfamily)
MRPLSIAPDSAYARLMQLSALMHEDDGALARRIMGAGSQTDVAAESELCRRFAPRIRLYGLRHLRSEAAAADLTQEVLLMTLQKLRASALREPDRLASFILGTCRQVVVDGRRSGTRRERILDTFAVEFVSIVDEDTHALDTDRLQQCLERLPERGRTVLLMSFYDDRPADAVGEQLRLSAGNVRVIRHRGIERLKACMQVAEATR